MSYDSNNIFAKILRAEIPCNKVYEDEFAIAFHDITPEAPVHVLVVPKGEYVSFDDFTSNAPESLLKGYFAAVQKTAKLLNLQESGYRIITNHGVDAAQSVAHFHMHILGGKNLGRLLG